MLKLRFFFHRTPARYAIRMNLHRNVCLSIGVCIATETTRYKCKLMVWIQVFSISNHVFCWNFSLSFAPRIHRPTLQLHLTKFQNMIQKWWAYLFETVENLLGYFTKLVHEHESSISSGVSFAVAESLRLHNHSTFIVVLDLGIGSKHSFTESRHGFYSRNMYFA